MKAETDLEDPQARHMRYDSRIADLAPRVTELLLAWRRGDGAALNDLVPLVERALHHIARRAMANERAGHSLQATALVLAPAGACNAGWASA